LEDVNRLLQIERHHLRATRRDLGVSSAAGRRYETKSDQQDQARTH
jgi:hypothetical protein